MDETVQENIESPVKTQETNFLPFIVLELAAVFAVTVGALITTRSVSATKKTTITTMNGKESVKLFLSSLCFLVGIYKIIKKYWKNYVQVIFDIYFFCTVIYVVTVTFSDLIGRTLLKKLPMGAVYVITALSLSVPIAALQYFTKNWIVSNIVAIFLSIATIDLTRIPSFLVACVLLAAFFFYDIYFVFFSDVMVTVAKSIKIPAKLVFPKSWESVKEIAFKRNTDQPTPDHQMSMLGLGDIVIPGMFVAVVARMEKHLNQQHPERKTRLVIPVLISYTIAVITAMICCTVFNSAQPVLLYIVPFVEVTSFICLLASKDLKAALSYNEEKLQKDAEEKLEVECNAGDSKDAADSNKEDEKTVEKLATEQ